ncbi:hypothetical protein Pmani_018225 [Petrolisthes manimaculis]|uniref:Uncharacterized protein n=1 Tax=Petrolisthes manimaculis TaxID=1843537 RepID=A0AAE1PNE0_9EUCA|nr:hypothetical protein Pmani_018225 [Petrolisthes manimaculis]
MMEGVVQQLVCEVKTARNLHWNYRHLKSIPEEVVNEGHHIENVNLKYNQLTHLPDNFGELRCLTTCHLSNNDLTSLPESMCQLSCLQSLDVGNNKLKTLPLSLGRLLSLRYLMAVNNHLSAFPRELCHSKTLSLLMLSGNHIKQLPDDMGELTGLQAFYVDHNNLRKLPRTLASLPVLLRISCCSNPLVFLPLTPFSSQPRIFVDNCPELNYLTLHQCLKHSNDFWEPLQIQAYGCFHNLRLDNNNNTVYITTTASPTNHNTTYNTTNNTLLIPSHIQTVTSGAVLTTCITSLKELCLRFLWTTERQYRNDNNVGKNKDPNKSNLRPELLPKRLCEMLRYGPVAKCNNIKCSSSSSGSIFTHVSIVVVKVSVSTRVLNESHNVPLVLFFCCDYCSKKYIDYLDMDQQAFSLWIRDKLRNNCLLVEY